MLNQSLFNLDQKLQELDKAIINVRSSLNDLVWDLIEKQQKSTRPANAQHGRVGS